MTHDALLDDLAAYALGTLPAADAARMREHLRDCPECAAEYAALTETTAALALGAEACRTGENGPPVSALLKGRIMREVRATVGDIRDDVAPQRRRATVWPTYLAAAACVILAAFAATSNLQTQRHMASMRTMLADVTSMQARRIAIPDGAVIVRGSHVYIAMHHMSDPPKGMVYQAWTLARGAKTVAPSMTFMPDADGVAMIAVPMDARTLAAVAVSIEPRGGSKTPTSKPIAFAALD